MSSRKPIPTQPRRGRMTVISVGSVVAAIAAHSYTAGGGILAFMTDPPPKFTVIIAVRNGAVTLQRALDSVIGQTHEFVELIVIDGASTDGTAGVLARNADHIEYWESKPDRGIYHAWNKALGRVAGDWICFLGADDRFHGPRVLATVAHHLANAPEDCRVAYGRVRVVNDRGDVIGALGGPWDRNEFIDHMSTPHPATFHRLSLFERHGLFDESYQIAGDYEYLLRELLAADATYIPEVVTDIGAGGISDRPSNRLLIAKEVHRAQAKHGLTNKPAWMSRSVIRAAARGLIARTLGERVARGVGPSYRRVRRALRQRGN